MNMYFWLLISQVLTKYSDEISDDETTNFCYNWYSMLCGPILKQSNISNQTKILIRDSGNCLSIIDKQSGIIKIQKNFTCDCLENSKFYIFYDNYNHEMFC